MSGEPPRVIGLAGGVGAGKSAVAAILRDLGCVVSDSDRDAREVMADPEVLEILRSWWGEGIVGSDGRLDRGAVADRVFADEDERRRLEDLVHPRLHRLRETRFEAAPEGVTALVLDAPLLFEAGLDARCDGVIFVDAPREIRAERVRRTRGWGDEELARREAAQAPLAEKRARATEVVRNDQDEDPALRGRVEAALGRILRSI